jgi:hypothetical protein
MSQQSPPFNNISANISFREFLNGAPPVTGDIMGLFALWPKAVHLPCTIISVCGRDLFESRDSNLIISEVQRRGEDGEG